MRLRYLLSLVAPYLFLHFHSLSFRDGNGVGIRSQVLHLCPTLLLSYSVSTLHVGTNYFPPFTPCLAPTLDCLKDKYIDVFVNF